MRSTALWVLDAAVLATNAAILAALDPGRGALVLMAAVTALLALATALRAWLSRGGPTPLHRMAGADGPLPEIRPEQ